MNIKPVEHTKKEMDIFEFFFELYKNGMINGTELEQKLYEHGYYDYVED